MRKFFYFIIIVFFIGGIWYIDRSKPPTPTPREEVQVTFVEGLTLDQEATQLESDFAIPKKETLAITGASISKQPFDLRLRLSYSFLRLLPVSRSLEGYLFPETYRVWKDLLPQSLIEKRLDKFQARFGSAILTKKSAPLSNLDDAVILASIVEREVRDHEDRKIVAGIFLRRMKIGMALQSDATLSYVLGSGRSRATDEDIASNSPYNTYRVRGLPPSPICNPSASAVDAVLNPIISNNLYFLTTKEGKVLYASSLEEHVKNRRKAGY